MDVGFERTQNFKTTGGSKAMELMNSKGEDEDNLCFFQTLRQMIAPTSPAIAEFTQLTIPSSSKPSSSKFKKKKQISSLMAHQTRFVLSPNLERLIFTLVEQTYVKSLRELQLGSIWERMKNDGRLE